MKFRLLIVFSLFIGIVLTTRLSGCRDKDAICPISVEGTLTDSLTGEPVADIEVLLYSNKIQTPALKSTDLLGRDTTDAAGHYYIENTVHCVDKPVVFHLGSDKYYPSAQVPVKDNRAESTIDFKLISNK